MLDRVQDLVLEWEEAYRLQQRYRHAEREVNHKLGNALRLLRERTSDEVSTKRIWKTLKVPYTAYRELENGHVRPENVVLLLQAIALLEERVTDA